MRILMLRLACWWKGVCPRHRVPLVLDRNWEVVCLECDIEGERYLAASTQERIEMDRKELESKP